MAQSLKSVRVIKYISIGLLILLLASPAIIFLPPGAIDWIKHGQARDPSGLDDGLQVTDKLEQYKLGSFFDNGTFGKPQDYKRAAYWYGKAAAQGFTQAQIRLAFIYDEGKGLPRNETEAFRLYSLAAENGHPHAQAILCTIYQEQRVTPQDMSKAFYWCQKAVDQNSLYGKYQLAILYLANFAPEKDVEKGLSLLRDAAAQQQPNAQQLLASIERLCPEGSAMRDACVNHFVFDGWRATHSPSPQPQPQK